VVGSGGPNGTHHSPSTSGPGVVIGRSGAGFGSAWWCEDDFWALNTGLFVSNFRQNHPKFVYYLLDFLDFSTFNSGGAQPSLNRNYIYPIPVDLPPLPEQRKIAEILHTWDNAIERLETLTRAETRVFGALRRRMFVSCSQEVPLRQVSTRIQRKSDGLSHTVMAISAKTGFVAQADKYRRDMAGASLASYTLLRRGEFAYNKGNSLTYPQGCIYALKADSALVPNVYYSFSLRADLNSSYYEHFFASGALNRQLAQRITSGVRGNGLLNLSAEEFFGVKVPTPDRVTQDGAADALNMGARKIELLQHKAELLRTQKRGLMQKLLTGQLRVNAAVEIQPGRLRVD
jgi:type I restriction enzyme S subunit